MENIRHDNLAQAITKVLIRQQWTPKERLERAKMGAKMTSKLFNMINTSGLKGSPPQISSFA